MRIEPSSKRVRVMLGGRWVADTDAPLLVWEKPYYPTYYFPQRDVDAAAMGDGRSHTADQDALDGYVALRWRAFDHWFEEDEEVFVHARDPYRRIDIVRSSRRVVVQVDGTVVADSRQAMFLFETGLARRHYLPLTDIRMDLLEPSDTRTRCPYKGEAHYWHVRIGETVHPDLVWSYGAPVHESAPIAGLACFYDERVDISVAELPRPSGGSFAGDRPAS